MYRYLTKFSPFERQCQTRANLVGEFEGAGGGGERGALNNGADFEYSKLGISQREYKSQNSLRFIRENFLHQSLFYGAWYFHGNTFSNYLFSLFCFFFHYLELFQFYYIILFDAMWTHNSSGFRSRSIRDVTLFAQRL